MDKFLDTKLKVEHGKYTTSVYRNKKLPMHWSSNVPKRIKRNIITNDLHRARKISTDLNTETNEIKEKYGKAGYPKRFVDSIIRNFNEKEHQQKEQNNEKKDDSTPFVPIKIPYCEKNEKISSHFLTKLKEFTGKNFAFTIVWQTRKIKTLFSIKDKVKHKANVIYKGTSKTKPEVTYIGETVLIAESRWKQHENPNHNSAPSKFLRDNANDQFIWEVICTSTCNHTKRKIHEALFIKKLKPILNKQVEHKKLILFPNGVT